MLRTTSWIVFVSLAWAQQLVSTITVNKQGATCINLPPIYTHVSNSVTVTTTMGSKGFSSMLPPFSYAPLSSTSSSKSAAPSASPLARCVNVCPRLDDELCKTPTGTVYDISCNSTLSGLVAFSGGLARRAYAADMASCLARCDASADCDGVSYNQFSDCLVYGSVLGERDASGGIAAVRMRPGSTSSSTSYSSSTSIAAMTGGSALGSGIVPFALQTGLPLVPGLPLIPPNSAPFPMPNATAVMMSIMGLMATGPVSAAVPFVTAVR